VLIHLRMIVIGRTRGGTDDCPTEHIEIVGSTGNIYYVTIDKLPCCTCPDSKKGNECKHKVYALHTVLRAPENMQYQMAFLSSELREIFENAPPIPTNGAENKDKDGIRKPIEGECPICYMDFDEENNDLVWCKAACGNNMHKSCFEQWAASRRGSTVKCVFCRTPWQMDNKDLELVRKAGAVNEEGYVNVAEQFGISEVRDHSPYHQRWVRRTLGMGW
jgi:Ring finger domain